jgi:hypothetical protein
MTRVSEIKIEIRKKQFPFFLSPLFILRGSDSVAVFSIPQNVETHWIVSK